MDETSGEEKEKEAAEKVEKDFYRSFFEEEQRHAEEEKEKAAKAKAEAEAEAEARANQKLLTENEKAAEVAEAKAKAAAIDPKVSEKTSEERLLEGVAYWSKMCEDRGDFEAPDAALAAVAAAEPGQSPAGGHESADEPPVEEGGEQEEEDAVEAEPTPSTSAQLEPDNANKSSDVKLQVHLFESSFLFQTFDHLLSKDRAFRY